jgi:peptidoglycan hydrolase-like protein with peptidoglycan-binding domain
VAALPSFRRSRCLPVGARVRRAGTVTFLVVLAAVTATAATATAATASSVPGPTSLVAAKGPGSAGTQPSAPVPPLPRNLPAAIEAPAPYVKQTACDPAPKPGALALGRLLLATYPGTSYGISRACATDSMASEHYEGRAVDWMTSVRDPQGAARAEALLRWLLAADGAGHAFANARRLGVMYLIWNDRIWGAYSASAGWRPYSGCASHPQPSYDTGCHRDHVHISLSWAGTMARTSYWTGRVAATDYGPCRPADLNWAPPYTGPNPAPCRSFGTVTAGAGATALAASIARYSGAVVAVGSTGPVVTAVQKALGVTADGQFGPLTGAAVSAFRSAHGLAASTRVDAPTWRALLAAVSAPASPSPSPSRSPSPSPSAGTGTAAGRPLLMYGDSGARVLAVQKALHVTPLSAWYGPVTRAAVAAFQAAHGLASTGSVDAVTAKMLKI